MELQPLVTCIMPTFNRRAFVPYAINYFQRQAYKNKELIIIDDGEDRVEDLVPPCDNIKYVRLKEKITLGAKLNVGCSNACGSIIMHWDDDDWYAPYRIDYQVAALNINCVEVCGINQLIYLDVRSNLGFEYKYPRDQPKWVLGSSLCYERNRWIKNNFKEINVGMDGLFVWNTPPEKISVLDDSYMSVHLIHDENVSPKNTENEWWKSCSLEKIKGIMKDDFNQYVLSPVAVLPRNSNTSEIEPHIPKETPKVKNLYACLVHEQIDCVIDLVRNLHFNDPDSKILIFNSNPKLEVRKCNFPFEEFGAVIYPEIVEAAHGYLHNFALISMKFALDNFSFDILTIVDSDQLSLKSGYSKFMGQYFADKSNIGLLSNRPARVTENCVDVFTAIKAFKEYDLWKPLLKIFPNGEDKFLHWSFWPSTVFTYDAVKDLVKLFSKNKLLKEIMNKTKIWATEEIILPTMVSLLGYDIKLNPCANDFVKYRADYTLRDLNKAFVTKDTFWVHPIKRFYDNDLRKYTRETLKYYSAVTADHQPSEPEQSIFMPINILNDVRQITGWLSDSEAELLLGYALKACQNFPETAIVEVGSYHGKATVLLGKVARSISEKINVYSIDLHLGILGSKDQGIRNFEPSLAHFKTNISKANLSKTVISIVDKAQNVTWNRAISLLLIDGLHDYLNVCNDFMPFSAHVEIGGYVAFHDYAEYFPDVMAFVNQLIVGKIYIKVALAGSLIVLQKAA